MSAPRPLGLLAAGSLGALVALGWVLGDLVFFVTEVRPWSALALAPTSLVAIGIGGVSSLLLRRPAAWSAALVASAALWLGGSFGSSLVGRARAEALVLFLLAWGLAALARRRLGHAGAPALGLGLLACVMLDAGRLGLGEPSARAVGLAGLALVVLALLAPLVPLGQRAAVARRVGATLVLGGLVLFAAVERRLERPSRADLPPPDAPLRAGGSALLVVLDTVRADRLASYGYERVTTPGLDAFARDEATLYARCRATAPFTLASHVSMLTGLFPSEHGAARPSASARPFRGDVPTLAERLRAAGLRTGAIVANDAYLNPTLGVDRGFEHFDDRGRGLTRHLALGQLLGGGDALRLGHVSHRDAAEITDEALAWLDRAPARPFFLMLNYLDAHTPYFPPGRYAELWEDGRRPDDPLRPRGEIRSLLYDRELAYLDREVTRLLDGLRERGRFDETLVVVTSDHGEDLLEHGIREHCWHLYESLLHVPLLVKPPGGRRVPRVDEPITIAEIYRLVQRALGLDPEQRAPRHGVVGEWYPVVPISERYGAWAEELALDVEADRLAWIDGTRKWIVSSSGRVEAYDLAVDPGEQDPLPLSREETERAVRRAHDWWSARPLSEEAEGELDGDQLRDLEALGYG